MNPKLKYRVARYLGEWGIKVQVKPRGRWRWLACDGNPKLYVDREEAELERFLSEQGPAYRRWFENSHISYR